jgi:acyl-coenzyme A synthetase/AMP-(fatty) acid ligase/3-hydroxymyristoyl/3-hydroxydecanoyl-(acyl carrier protein) dehydratase
MTRRIGVPPELFDTPLLAADRHLALPALVGAQRSWRWSDIHHAAMALARRLDGATAVCNLCSSRVSFLVTLLAALRSRHLTVLPPSGGNADLAGILAASERPVIVVDDLRAIQPAWRESAQCIVCEPVAPDTAVAAAELAWQPAWHDVSVLLYTSGSTGTPETQPKTLLDLATGALVLGARLAQDIEGGLGAIRRIVCSVPPQHMFGLEASVMLSLVHGMPVLDRRPLLPADVQDAFAASPPAAWIATPLHLRSLVQMDTRLPNCSVVVASTMPLTQALAQQTEDRVQAPVLEIYGSTETGVLAMRRSARDTHWLPVRGVHVEAAENGALATGSHFASPVKLLDQVDVDANGRFSLLGRQADLIKIAGRRASLGGLNLLLQELPGLGDAVFYLPASDSPTERLCLIHTGTLDRSAIDRWLRSRLDPAFMPRSIVRVERLPRSDSGKLPRQALDALYAAWRAASAAAAVTTRFEFVVAADHPALPGHFPGRPIVPGVLLLDRVLAGVQASFGRSVRTLQRVKFVSALLPDECATVLVEGDGDSASLRFGVQVVRDGASVTLASGVLVAASSAAPPTGNPR